MAMSRKYETATYPGEVSGANFRMELSFKEVRIWIANHPGPTVIKSSDLQSVATLLDGSTKVAVALHRDVIVPTSKGESERVVNALNALMDEQDDVRLRDAGYGEDR